MVAPQSSSKLQHTLQLVVQSVQWTYSLFWRLCPQQGILVWGEGYYNGAIKTRKTVQPMEVSTEEASLQRSQQLRELYESLSAGEANQPARRPCAALSPEDLTESEWFYLMCVSFSFPPGVGLPGKAFARRRHVWLTRANEADSKVFSRAILAKSARIQTVVCIPLMDGVLELGSTENVEEDIGLVQHANSFFTDHQDIRPKPALSEHSTSNPTAYTEHQLGQSQATMQQMSVDPHGSNQEEDEEEEEDDDDDDDNEEDIDHNDADDDADEVEAGSGSEGETRRYNVGIFTQKISPNLAVDGEAIPATEPSELMQLEMSDGIRLGSPDDCSNNLDTEMQMLAGCRNSDQSNQQQRDGSYQAWHFLHDNLCNGFPQLSETQIQELSPEDAHYSETVSTILQNNLSRWVDSNPIGYLPRSQQSSFSRWNSRKDHQLNAKSEGISQWLLKNILFNIPNLHCKYKDDNSPKSRDGDGGIRFRKGTPQEELSANHVLAERRRREKLNERFIILRSLVPFVTKMDKASILGDTIEYVKQLRRRIQDLESRNRLMETEQRLKASEIQKPGNSKDQSVQKSSGSTPSHTVSHILGSHNRTASSDKRKVRVLEGAGKPYKAVEVPRTNVQVSIIESDALLELQCPYREGLLLKIMQMLHELRLEITSMQSSSANGTLVAELRAKVKEIHGKRASIVEVKKAIHRIFSQY